ncbi:poly-gamma-glutamate synthesis protein (capsule biosynthesis protein) [Spinactinospora alkalitolerans]|uniref:Poly-gamma-glutamate synthesis protein (Capsule biosynthesis protein) n=1 Tax=Spinactinospora alkalitolerans TaxID=687207 RepID=A0A852TLX6_9ACTN|nr:CapA family protein [Spinactinospora alkalitolerans]NYE44938.1 poly-gamma-glutamate synthesis protein (capsule biosynthesis protein) [Spinactinospora alkalitolerans]
MLSSSPRTDGARRLGALFAIAALATACGTAPTDSSSDLEPNADATPADEGPATPSEAPAEPFTIAFGGDVHFETVLRSRLDSDPETALGPVSSVLGEADIAMVNLETAVTEGGTQAPGKQFVFRAPPTALQALRSAGVDVATVANNHGMDFGRDGLADTLDNAEEAGFPLVGAGRDADEAYAPHIVEANGNEVAILGATDVLDDHLIAEWTAGEDKPGMASTKGEMLDRMLRAVSEAEEQADSVIVYLHWGLEGDHCPLPHAPDLARQLIDAGADAVVGGHAHVLSPGGYMGDAYVHYGLGNFAFYNFDGPTAETGVLELTMQGGEVLEDEWLPGRIQGGVPVMYEGEAAGQARDTWEGHRATCTPDLGAEPGGGSSEGR